jgi:hypothetical protein
MFNLPVADQWKEVHATLNVTVKVNVTTGQEQHPAVFIGGQTKLWQEYEDWRQDDGESQPVTQQHRAAALVAVRNLLLQWSNSMTGSCQSLLNRLAQPQEQDIFRNPLP